MIRLSDCDAALMNARKKEKKKMLAESKKPSRPSEWLALGEHWLAWAKNNPWSTNIDDYANAHGYRAYTFKKDWPKESEVFKGYLEQCVSITHARRNAYMDLKDKFYLQILKELPLYNWDYRDYEADKATQDKSVFGRSEPVLLYQPLSEKVLEMELKKQLDTNEREKKVSKLA